MVIYGGYEGGLDGIDIWGENIWVHDIEVSNKDECVTVKVCDLYAGTKTGTKKRDLESSSQHANRGYLLQRFWRLCYGLTRRRYQYASQVSSRSFLMLSRHLEHLLQECLHTWLQSDVHDQVLRWFWYGQQLHFRELHWTLQRLLPRLQRILDVHDSSDW
jgi:hypothetical protein